MVWHAATSALTSFSFYQGTAKPKRFWIFETLKDPIYEIIILIIPGISLKLKIKNTDIS